MCVGIDCRPLLSVPPPRVALPRKPPSPTGTCQPCALPCHCPHTQAGTSGHPPASPRAHTRNGCFLKLLPQYAIATVFFNPRDCESVCSLCYSLFLKKLFFVFLILFFPSSLLLWRYTWISTCPVAVYLFICLFVYICLLCLFDRIFPPKQPGKRQHLFLQ